VDPVQLVTSDGLTLDGDVAAPQGAPRAAVVVCHPHPQHGGNRFDHVVGAIVDALPPIGVAALRFDFRAAHDGGVAERLDVVAALDELEQRYPGTPLHVAGYSFGAVVGLAVDDQRVASKLAVAPPLTMMPVGPPSPPTLVLVPAHDQFCPPDVVRTFVDGWPDARVEVIEMGDHFLRGRTGAVAEHARAWFSA
jgi:alpha/beta superfamily hydrolase